MVICYGSHRKVIYMVVSCCKEAIECASGLVMCLPKTCAFLFPKGREWILGGRGNILCHISLFRWRNLGTETLNNFPQYSPNFTEKKKRKRSLPTLYFCDFCLGRWRKLFNEINSSYFEINYFFYPLLFCHVLGILKDKLKSQITSVFTSSVA